MVGPNPRPWRPWMTPIVVAGVALATLQCSALVDTGGLSGPIASAKDGEADTPIDNALSDASSSDATDAWTLPPGATVWPTNGHAYLVVGGEPIVWDVARTRAAAMGGHLVTIESSSENEFVFGLAKKVDAAWLVEGGLQFGPWIGASQAPGSTEPAGGYRWVTGEPFAFVAWAFDEPSDGTPHEDVVHFFAGTERSPKWNDTDALLELSGYIVEFE